MDLWNEIAGLIGLKGAAFGVGGVLFGYFVRPPLARMLAKVAAWFGRKAEQAGE